jgi:hypothetical protein
LKLTDVKIKLTASRKGFIFAQDCEPILPRDSEHTLPTIAIS